MKCPSCGAETNGQFCSGCGTHILSSEPMLKSESPKNTNKLGILIIIIVFVLFIALVNSCSENTSEKPKIGNADEYVEQAIEALNQNNEEKAITLIDKAETIYPEYPNKATELEAQMYKSQDINEVKKELIKMTDEELNLLTQGKLEKRYFQLEYLNNKFINLLKENSSERAVYIAEEQEKAEQERIAAEQAARTEMIENQFSSWDGAHVNLTRYIEENMNNPKSFEHVETVYWDMGDYLVVRTTFRGTNAFGGIVTNYVKAKVDLNGNVLEIMEWI